MQGSVRDQPAERLYQLLEVALDLRVRSETANVAADGFDVIQRPRERQHGVAQRLNVLRGQHLR